MADVNFTSINTKDGFSLLTFKIKGTQGQLAANEQIQEIFSTPWSVNRVLGIEGESGAVVYD